MMTINRMLNALIESGLTEKEVAESIGCSQPTVHRIKHGAGTDYKKGKAIEALYQERVARDTSARSAVA